MSQCQHCVTSPRPPPPAAVRWTSWYRCKMMNMMVPSHAFAKVNHSSWLYIQFNLQVTLSCIQTATTWMKMIISLFLFFFNSASRGRHLDDVAAVSGSARSKHPSCNRDILSSLCIVPTVLTEFYDNKQRNRKPFAVNLRPTLLS